MTAQWATQLQQPNTVLLLFSGGLRSYLAAWKLHDRGVPFVPVFVRSGNHDARQLAAATVLMQLHEQTRRQSLTPDAMPVLGDGVDDGPRVIDPHYDRTDHDTPETLLNRQTLAVLCDLYLRAPAMTAPATLVTSFAADDARRIAMPSYRRERDTIEVECVARPVHTLAPLAGRTTKAHVHEFITTRREWWLLANTRDCESHHARHCGRCLGCFRRWQAFGGAFTHTGRASQQGFGFVDGHPAEWMRERANVRGWAEAMGGAYRDHRVADWWRVLRAAWGAEAAVERFEQLQRA